MFHNFALVIIEIIASNALRAAGRRISASSFNLNSMRVPDEFCILAKHKQLRSQRPLAPTSLKFNVTRIKAAFGKHFAVNP